MSAMKRKILTIRNVTRGDRHLFMVAVPQSITNTKRVRKFFRTYNDAQRYIDNVVRHTGYEKADFRETEPTGPILNFYISKYLAEIRKNKPTWMQACRILENLGRHFGTRPIANITRDNMLKWQDTVTGSTVTVHNHQRVVRRFFKWCIEDLEDGAPIGRSPMAHIKRIKVERGKPRLLLPSQMAECLAYAKEIAETGDRRLLAYLCIGGFHGIRTEEIIRMDWRHLDWKNAYVHVLKPENSKTQERHPVMQPALRKHLEPFALPSGQIIPAESSNAAQIQMHRRRKPMLEKLGIVSWPHNTLRHSYKSFHEILNGHDHTQREMGHSNPNMTRYGYGTHSIGEIWLTKEMAQEWFAL